MLTVRAVVSGVASAAVAVSALWWAPGAYAAASPFFGEQRAVTPAPLTSLADAGVDVREAVAEAASSGERVEVEAERTQSSTTWANPDGTATTEVSAAPVRVRDASGEWVPVDYSLVMRADGSLAPAASPAEVVFSGGGDDVAATVSLADGESVQTRWVEVLPAPVVEGPTATYALAEGLDLQVTATAFGYSAHFVLAHAPAVPLEELVVGLTTEHLALSENAGRVTATNPDGDAAGRVGQLVAWDSSRDEAGDRVLVPLEAELAQSARSGSTRNYSLTLGLPEGWLTDPDTVYPVTIDPDVITNNAAQDTSISQANPVTNYATASHLIVGQTASVGNNWYSLLQFPVGGEEDAEDANLNPGDPRHDFRDKNITNATLILHQYYAATCSPRDMRVRVIAEDWISGDVTYDTRPSLEGVAATPSFNHGASGCSRADQSMDVTDVMHQWLSLGNHGLHLGAPATDSGTSYQKRFCSRNALVGTSESCNSYDYAPRLAVTYDLTAQTGDLPWMSTQDFTLSDSTTAQVNLKSGNLLVSSHDVGLSSVGVAPQVNRYYNSLSTRTSPYFGNWTLGAGKDVGVRVTTTTVASTTSRFIEYLGPNGFVVRSYSDGGTYSDPRGIKAKVTKASADPYKITYKSSNEELVFGATDAALGSGGGWISSDKDTSGIGTTYSYAGDVTTMTDHAGRQVTVDTGGAAGTRTATAADPLGREWDYSIVGGRLTAVQSPLNTSAETYEYDAQGRLIVITVPVRATGDVIKRTLFSYDSAGRVESVERGWMNGATFVSTAETVFSYGGNDTYGKSQTVVTDPRGNDATFDLDMRGRTTKTEDALGRTRGRSWNFTDDVTSLVDGFAGPAGPNEATIDYDDQGRAIGTQLPTGAATSALYQNDGGACPTAQTGAKLTYLVKCAEDAALNSSTFQYNSDGLTTQKRTEGAVDFTNTYEVAAGTVCDGFKGQVCSSEDGNGNITNYTYDDDGNVIEVDPPGTDLGATTYEYDEVSRLTSVTDGNGDTTEYTYDDLDRVLTTTFASGNVIVNVWNGDGTLASMSSSVPSDPSSTVWSEAYTYSALGQELQRVVGYAGALQTVSQSFDAAGNLTGYTDSSGTTSYAYDVTNHLLRVQLPGGSCTTTAAAPAAGSNCVKFSYDDNGAETRRTFPGGAFQARSYDGSSRVNRIWANDAAGVTRVDVRYRYDTARDGSGSDTANITRRTSVLEQGVTANATTDYSYDVLNRLSRAVESSSSGSASWVFAYDAAGNRVSQTRSGSTGSASGTVEYEYNAVHQLTSTSEDEASSSWRYDSAGNQVEDARRGAVTSYGQRGNVEVLDALPLTSIGQGNTQVVRVGSGANEQSWLNAQTGVTRVSDSSGVTRAFRDADGGLIGYARSGTHFFVADHLDSVVGMFSSAGVWEGGYSYTPYGEARHTGAATAVVENRFRYIGGWLLGEDLYKLGARIYDAQLGRFTQMDPSGQSANPYSYAAGNPISMSDPSGLLETLAGMLIAGLFDAAAIALVAAATSVGGPLGYMVGVAAAGLLINAVGGFLSEAVDGYIVGSEPSKRRQDSLLGALYGALGGLIGSFS